MNKFRNTITTLVIWLLIPIAIYSLGMRSGNKSNTSTSVSLSISEFVQMVRKKDIESVKMGPEKLLANAKEGKKISVSYPVFYSPRLIDDLVKESIPVTFSNENHSSSGMRFLIILGQLLSWLPIVIMLWFAYSIFKNMNGGGSNSKNNNGNGGGLFGSSPFGFGKSKAKVIETKNIKVSFKDVAGMDEAKKDVVEIVDFLKEPYRYSRVGGVIPKGCLLIGYPGTGKTLLAKAIAAEARVPFFFISGSDFVEMFVGVGASRVRDLFAQAKKRSPCIVFIDEIDAVGRSRGTGIGGGNDEREQTLNQLLVEMDGFEDNNGVIVIAATNRPDVLDPALLRPGRFDRQITIPLPDIKGRTSILDVHMKKIRRLSSIDSSVIARGTPGFSGADLANLVNEAALLAARERQELVTMDDFESAKDKLLMGNKKDSIMKESERKLTAYHEGGHALLAFSLKASDPVHKITIIPRGRALGVVIRLPKDDQFSITYEKMIADIIVGLGGRVAEELIFGHDMITSGASSDIQQVTNLARSMVVKWGLSDKVGLINYSNSERGSYLHKGGEVPYDCSQDTAKLIDEEVRKIVDECYQKAKKMLSEKRKELDLIAETLLEYETLTGDDLHNLIEKNEKPVKSKGMVKSKSILGGILSGVHNSKRESNESIISDNSLTSGEDIDNKVTEIVCDDVKEVSKEDSK